MNKSLLIILTFFIHQTAMLSQVLQVEENTFFNVSGNTTITMNNTDLLVSGELNGKESTFLMNSMRQDLFIEGNSKPIFGKLILNSSNETVLNVDLEVNDYLRLISGDLNLQAHNLYLPTDQAKIEGETITKKIYTELGGEIIKTTSLLNLNDDDIGNLGLKLDNFINEGQLILRRGHQSIPIPFGKSITRYYKIEGDQDANNSVEVTLDYFDDEAERPTFNYQELLWVFSDGEWQRTKPLAGRKVDVPKNFVTGSLDKFHATLTVGLHQKLVKSELIPTVFTPNGDGKNDQFVIPNIGELTKLQVNILNISGELIFQTTDYANNYWDGTQNGKALPVGKYIYTIKDPVSPTDLIKGEISILR